MPAMVNEPVDYVSPYRSGTWDAVVTKVNDDGTVAIDIYMPGLAVSRGRGIGAKEPILSLRSVSYGPLGLARPRRLAAAAAE